MEKYYLYGFIALGILLIVSFIMIYLLYSKLNSIQKKQLQLDEKRLNGPRPSAGDGGPGAGSGEVQEEDVVRGQEGEEHQQPCQDQYQHQAQVAP